ncbi:MAG: two-component sensor histidine kinase [Ramlibacter sp.]|uniref:sensor histidine kinase n=1 Tax=Ramlibacter sp. TaxID=1917967 RepID=UPI00260A3FDB|nr:HAMP domain-containing sensor histidine kinase [Ramlibacter sp.]MDB5752081.1 two-component sensor histidine kinase [Ramlibacter sp.]
MKPSLHSVFSIVARRPRAPATPQPRVRLRQFIDGHMEQILTEWVAFARTLDPGAMSVSQLSDHAEGMLRSIAIDIDESQNEQERYDKSRGHALGDAARSAASVHGKLRHASNFSLLQLSAEFRALRATVLRLWLPLVGEINADTMREVIRFNEAIDQALAESILTWSARADQVRELFLAILGHDLRAPLSTLSLAGELLGREPSAADTAQIGARVRRGSRLMAGMVEDLIGYTRTQLGNGMPMAPATIDVGAVARAAVEDASATHPRTRFETAIQGDLVGTFDSVRLHQLFTNLLVNAGQHGAEGQPVTLHVEGDADSVTVQVRNRGPAIPQESWESIFQPLVQLSAEESDGRDVNRTSLGLGLFVAREIAVLHGGSIAVRSDEAEGTVFTARLPRSAAVQAGVH